MVGDIDAVRAALWGAVADSEALLDVGEYAAGARAFSMALLFESSLGRLVAAVQSLDELLRLHGVSLTPTLPLVTTPTNETGGDVSGGMGAVAPMVTAVPAGDGCSLVPD